MKFIVCISAVLILIGVSSCKENPPISPCLICPRDFRVTDFEPAWSPDGNLIAFASSGDIIIMQKDGTDFQRITETSEQGIGGFFTPQWSPDGKQLVIRWFAVDGSGITNVFIVNNDGNGLTKILDDPTVTSVDWSR